jgi:hypothetical protein
LAERAGSASHQNRGSIELRVLGHITTHRKTAGNSLNHATALRVNAVTRTHDATPKRRDMDRGSSRGDQVRIQDDSNLTAEKIE